MQPADHPILFFDGVCNLCNGFVTFIIRHDRRGLFRFAPLQSTHGEAARQAIGPTGGDTLILFHKGRYHTRSGAALRIAALLGWPWRALAALFIFPPFIRDAVYRTVARNRYRWFGKRDACMLPTPELQGRFLA